MTAKNDAVYPLLATLLLGSLVTVTGILLFTGKPIESQVPDSQPTAESATQQTVADNRSDESASTAVASASEAETAAAENPEVEIADAEPTDSSTVAMDSAEDKAAEGGTVHTIKMLNVNEDGSMVFEPGYLLAQPGDTVVFEPADMAHNTRSVLVPEGADDWQSTINEGITITLTEEGVYLYVCEPHSALAMAGVIQVGEAVNLDAAKAKADELSETFLLEKERLVTYLAQIDDGAVADTDALAESDTGTDAQPGTASQTSGTSSQDVQTIAADDASDSTAVAVTDNSNKQAPAPAAQPTNDTAAATVHTIKMLNNGADGLMVFEPGFVLAQPGDTIIFEPADMAHNTKSVLVPDGAEQWQSTINEGITLTLTEQGLYVYLCEPHSTLAMAGVIQVGEPVNLEAAQAKVDELSASFAIGKDRLPGYLNQVQ